MFNGKSTKNGHFQNAFSIAMLNYQRVSQKSWMIIYKIWGLDWLENYWIMMIQSVYNPIDPSFW
jgi:hypothetical protein